ncbi:MAG: hypothetical protein KA144_16625, partial [Xanthomonadaceae bacterium]|nr:hypothetical protein [Xanthomonadaceae bacterium]
LSSRIACWSFPIFGAISVLVIGIERAVLTDRVAGLVGELAMMSIAMFVMIMLASLVLFIPALLVEYTVVRLVRSDRMRAVLSGVES